MLPFFPYRNGNKAAETCTYRVAETDLRDLNQNVPFRKQDECHFLNEI